MNMKWYVINVLNSKESQIKEKIEDAIDANKVKYMVGQVLAPKEKYFQIRKGKKIKAERNYFPGYIFIECNINGELIKIIETVSGVKSFLKGNNGPIPMIEREVKNLLSKVQDNVEVTDNVSLSKQYMVGTQVNVIDGPFAGFVGNITNIDEHKKIIGVDIMVFNRPTPIKLSPDQIIQ